MLSLLRSLIAVCLLSVACLVQAQIAVPPVQGRVTDTTGALSAEARQDLDARLAAIETQKGSQVVILLVPSTQPEDLAAFGIRVADAWKIGRGKVDDGVILLVALQDRKLRIEVGRGLEGAIPDAIAKRIISEDIAPHFKQGDFHGGLAAGVDRIAERIGAEPLPPPAAVKRDEASSLGPIALIVLVVIIMALIKLFDIGGSGYRTVSRRGARSGVLPGGFSGGGLGGGWGGGGGGGGFRGGGGGFGGGGASGGW